MREEAALAALKSQCADAVGVHRSLSASLTSSTTAAERLQEAIDDVCMWVVHTHSRVRHPPPSYCVLLVSQEQTPLTAGSPACLLGVRLDAQPIHHEDDCVCACRVGASQPCGLVAVVLEVGVEGMEGEVAVAGLRRH